MKSRLSIDSRLEINLFPIAFYILLVTSIVIRLFGVKFGLPYLYEADEPFFVTHAIHLIGEKTLNPGWFQHPGTTTLYSLAFLYMALAAIGILTGYYPNNEFFLQSNRNDPTLVYFSGRLLILALSIVCLLLVYFIAKRLFNRWIGLLAMAILAFNPLFLEYSRIIRTDIHMTLFLLISFWFCLNILEHRRNIDYIIAGFAVGLAIATKYPAAFFIPIIVIAHFQSAPFAWYRQWKLILAGFTCVAGTFIGSPYLFIEFRKVFSALEFENSTLNVGGLGTGPLGNFVWYVFNQLPEVLTFLGLLLWFFSIILMLRSKKKSWVLLVIYPILFLALISFLNLRWTRWLIPILPFISIGVAFTFFRLPAVLIRWVKMPKLTGWISAALIIVLMVPLLITDASRIRELRGKDTRTIGREWILENIPRGSNLLVEVYSPQLPLNYYNYYVSKLGMIKKIDKNNYDNFNFQPTWVYSNTLGKIEDLANFCQYQIDFIIHTNLYRNYFTYQEIYPEIVKTYKTLFQYGQVIQEFKPVPGENQGPYMQIIKVTECDSK